MRALVDPAVNKLFAQDEITLPQARHPASYTAHCFFTFTSHIARVVLPQRSHQPRLDVLQQLSKTLKIPLHDTLRHS